MLRRQQVLDWLDLFFWQSVCGLIPFQAKFLKRFNFESLVYPRLGVEFLKYYFIECPCRRIAWSSSPWITRFEFLFTSLDEVWPAYLLWSWINLVAEVLAIFFAIYKYFVMGHCIVVFNIVVVLCIVLYVVCVVLSIVSWSFMCVYCGFLPRFDVPFCVVVTLVAGRISLIL